MALSELPLDVWGLKTEQVTGCVSPLASFSLVSSVVTQVTGQSGCVFLSFRVCMMRRSHLGGLRTTGMRMRILLGGTLNRLCR